MSDAKAQKMMKLTPFRRKNMILDASHFHARLADDCASDELAVHDRPALTGSGEVLDRFLDKIAEIKNFGALRDSTTPLVDVALKNTRFSILDEKSRLATSTTMIPLLARAIFQCQEANQIADKAVSLPLCAVEPVPEVVGWTMFAIFVTGGAAIGSDDKSWNSHVSFDNLRMISRQIAGQRVNNPAH